MRARIEWPWVGLLVGTLLLAGCAGLGLKSGVPDSVARPFQRALQLMQRGAYLQALLEWQNVTKIDDSLPGVYVNIAICQTHLDRDQQALAALDQALKLDPNQAAALNQKGILLRRSGDFKAAEQSYRAVLKSNPDYPLAHLNLGVLCDLYLQQRSCALRAYQNYQKLTGSGDKEVAKWIAELQRR